MRVVANYMRYTVPLAEEFETVDEAFRFLAIGEENENLSSVSVVDGETTYERDSPEFERLLHDAWDALI